MAFKCLSRGPLRAYMWPVWKVAVLFLGRGSRQRADSLRHILHLAIPDYRYLTAIFLTIPSKSEPADEAESDTAVLAGLRIRKKAVGVPIP